MSEEWKGAEFLIGKSLYYSGVLLNPIANKVHESRTSENIEMFLSPAQAIKWK